MIIKYIIINYMSYEKSTIFFYLIFLNFFIFLIHLFHRDTLNIETVILLRTLMSGLFSLILAY